MSQVHQAENYYYYDCGLLIRRARYAVPPVKSFLVLRWATGKGSTDRLTKLLISLILYFVYYNPLRPWNWPDIQTGQRVTNRTSQRDPGSEYWIWGSPGEIGKPNPNPKTNAMGWAVCLAATYCSYLWLVKKKRLLVVGWFDRLVCDSERLLIGCRLIIINLGWLGMACGHRITAEVHTTRSSRFFFFLNRPADG